MVSLKSIINFRDVGETINSQLGTEWIKPGKLYRAARPDESSLADRNTLRLTLNIRTIIDLRTTTEHDQQAAARKNRLGNTDPRDEEAQRPAQIEGIHYELVNFNGHAYSKYLISHLTWAQFLRLVYLMAIGRRLEAISILGVNVMRPRGLSGLAVDSVDVCKDEVRAVFEILGDEEKYPVMLHCTQGKDRTGLTVLMVLMLLGTEMEAIQHDYMLSAPELKPEREAKLKEIHSIGLPDEFADCDPELVGKVVEHIREKYGSIEKYLENCGVTKELREKVRNILTGAEHPPYKYE